MRKMVVAGLAAGAVALLGGCAPGLSFAVANPSCTSAPWTTHSRMNVKTVTNRVQAASARYSAGYRFQQRNPDNWRHVASGECR